MTKPANKRAQRNTQPRAAMHLYLGRAGEARVMSEFLIRGYNIAVPEIDFGDDLFVVTNYSDHTPIEITQVQIKTCSQDKNGKFQANIKGSQLERPANLFYVFVFFAVPSCLGCLVQSRNELNRIFLKYKPEFEPHKNKPYPEQINLTMSIETGDTIRFWNNHVSMNDWTAFPQISR